MLPLRTGICVHDVCIHRASLMLQRLTGTCCVCSVTTQEVVDAVNMQTGRQLDRRAITLPDIKNCGNYDAEVKLHEEVTGRFKVVVQKDTTK